MGKVDEEHAGSCLPKFQEIHSSKFVLFNLKPNSREANF